MSRSPSQTAAETDRAEYSEPEQLDRILAHLRRIRDEHETAKKPERVPAPANDAPPAANPREHGSQQAVRPPSTPQAAAAVADNALRHLPPSTAERLTAFVAGKPETPSVAQAIPEPAPQPAVRPVAASAPVPSLASALRTGGELSRALAASRPAFIAAGVFSFVINILMLAGPLFMLQVYDRVMTSGSMPTLVALSLLTAAIYGVIGLLEMVRSRVVVRVGIELDRRIGDRVFQAALRRGLQAPGSSLAALRELDGLRQFIAGPGPLAFFDAPWTPVYLLVVFLLHWTLGIASVIGAILLVVIAWASEVRSRAPLLEAGRAAGRSLELAEASQRNAEAIQAMGMLGAVRGRWQTANAESLGWQVLAADRLGSLSSLSKALRLLLQSMMLAIGAALAIKGDISAGSIVAATIIFGRALAPVEQALGHWRSFIKARESYEKIGKLLADYPAPPERTTLPVPQGHLEVSNLKVAAPETRVVLLAGVSFAVTPGRMVAVIGPSASGKSTLARALVGLWEPVGGSIRLDGARLDQWNNEALGRHIGYLPQDLALFAGSIRENIARFREDATDEQVVEAAKAAHAHDLIMALPNGYETDIGPFGAYLSAGQRQRVGLARALFGRPALVVLDEPNANLDRLGDEALSAAIDGMRERGQAIVLISHRVQAIGKADDLLYIERGAQRAFGPRAEVIRFLQAGMPGQGATPAPSGQPAAAAQGAADPASKGK